MLDADGTLEFARAAGGALKWRNAGDVFSEQRFFALGTEFVQITPHAERDFLRVQDLSGIGRRAVFGAASALDARIRLERDQFGYVLAGVETEILVARKRRDLAELLAFEEHGDGTQNQVQVLGVRDQRHENQQGQSVGPPQGTAGIAAGQKSHQVGDHQEKDEKSDHTRLVRQGSQPLRTDHEAAEREGRDRNRDGDPKHGCDREIDPAEEAIAADEFNVQAFGEMIDGHEREGAESPKDECMGDPRQRPLDDHLSLKQYFPNKSANAASDGLDVKAGIFLRCRDDVPDFAETKPEAVDGSRQKDQKHNGFRPGKLNHNLRV